jgi:hypothetical protein
VLALKKGQLKTIQETKQKMNPCKNKTHKKYKKKFQIRRHPTHDRRSRYDKKITTKGYYTTCLIKKKQKTEKKLSGIFMFILQLFFKSEKKICKLNAPPTPPGFYSILLHGR